MYFHSHFSYTLFPSQKFLMFGSHTFKTHKTDLGTNRGYNNNQKNLKKWNSVGKCVAVEIRLYNPTLWHWKILGNKNLCYSGTHPVISLPVSSCSVEIQCHYNLLVSVINCHQNSFNYFTSCLSSIFPTGISEVSWGSMFRTHEK